MEKERLAAFSDGVLAIIITIMVLELKVPHNAELSALFALWPVFVSYVLSFLYVGIYWNNHHHMMHSIKRVNGAVPWRNLHLLFWLSLLPFTTGWMGENHFARWPTVVYGLNLMLCAMAYQILEMKLIAVDGREGLLASAVGKDRKGRLSLVLYIAGLIAAAFFAPLLGMVFFVAVALVWFVPDRRIEQRLTSKERLR